MTETEREHDSVLLDGGSLGSLLFERCEDRYRHEWIFPNSATKICSIESGPDEFWPSSPPLQQIHSQSFADGREVIFGVGMAGRGHWSASFTLVPDLKCWIVELACRSSALPERLECSYHIENARWGESSGAVFCCDPDAKITLEAIEPSTTGLRRENQVVLRPSSESEFSPGTIQWAFRLRVGD